MLRDASSRPKRKNRRGNQNLENHDKGHPGLRKKGAQDAQDTDANEHQGRDLIDKQYFGGPEPIHPGDHQKKSQCAAKQIGLLCLRKHDGAIDKSGNGETHPRDAANPSAPRGHWIAETLRHAITHRDSPETSNDYSNDSILSMPSHSFPYQHVCQYHPSKVRPFPAFHVCRWMNGLSTIPTILYSSGPRAERKVCYGAEENKDRLHRMPPEMRRHRLLARR